MKCFVGFFGLNRSLSRTADSIRKNIFEPLDAEACDYVRCAHFNYPEVIHSLRSGEHNVPATRDGIDELNLNVCWIEPQNEVNILPSLFVACEGLDAVGDQTGSSMINFLHQLYSLQQLWRICRMLGEDQFELFILLRPDLRYLDRLPIKRILLAICEANFDVITPSWQRWGGLNDRFAFCSARGAAVYMDRLRLVPQFVRDRGFLHPESLLSYAIREGGMLGDYTSMRAVRVRANGTEQAEDFSL